MISSHTPATQAKWGTPTARDYKDTGDLSKHPIKGMLPRQVLAAERLKKICPTREASASHGPSEVEIQAGNPKKRLETEVEVMERSALETPNARDSSAPGAGTRAKGDRKSSLLGFTKDVHNSGSLNPTWVEWLMGFPLGWTELEVSEMPLSRRSRNFSAGKSSPSKKGKKHE